MRMRQFIYAIGTVSILSLFSPPLHAAENSSHWGQRDELFEQALKEDGEAYDEATEKLMNAAEKRQLLKFFKPKANKGKRSRLLATILVHRLSMSPEERNELLSLNRTDIRPGSAYARATGQGLWGREGWAVAKKLERWNAIPLVIEWMWKHKHVENKVPFDEIVWVVDGHRSDNESADGEWEGEPPLHERFDHTWRGVVAELCPTENRHESLMWVALWETLLEEGKADEETIEFYIYQLSSMYSRRSISIIFSLWLEKHQQGDKDIPRVRRMLQFVAPMLTRQDVELIRKLRQAIKSRGADRSAIFHIDKVLGYVENDDKLSITTGTFVHELPYSPTKVVKRRWLYLHDHGKFPEMKDAITDEEELTWSIEKVTGLHVDEKKRLREQFVATQEGAKDGEPHAQFELGELYWRGIGVEHSYEKARRWYLKAAEQGHDKAMVRIGYMYAYGLGGEHRHDEVKEWYKKAGDKGNLWGRHLYKEWSKHH